jgi:RimJ/RimL family protein N-acetyltransferase
VPVLRTERLVMRGWRDEDYEAFAEILGHPDVATRLGRPRPTPPHEAWREMAMLAGHWVLKGFGHWVLESRETGEVVGRAGLFHPPEWPGMEVGWTIGRAHWGKGYAPEAGRASCDWAHRTLGAAHILSLIHPENANSIRVAEKLGLVREGHHSASGHAWDVYGSDLPLGSAGTRGS